MLKKERRRRVGVHPLAGWLAGWRSASPGGEEVAADGRTARLFLASRRSLIELQKPPQIPGCDTLMFLVRASWREPEGKKKKKEKLGGGGAA